MRFVTFVDRGSDRVGVLRDDMVHALPVGVSILDLLQAGETSLLDAGTTALTSSSTVLPLSEVGLRAPVPNPPTVRDYMTFEQHVAGTGLMLGPETKVPPRWYEAPRFYFTNPYAIRGPQDEVPITPGSQRFDLELEVAAVIGRTGNNVAPDRGSDYIAGYTILVDWSARDIQFAEMEVPLGPTKGKDTATTLGPVLVTADELEPYRSGTSFDLGMRVEINGQLLGEDRLDSMAFSFGDMVAYASRGTEVRPGDVLGTGTCGGGCLAEHWGRRGMDAIPPLEPGDVVTVSVDQLGSMSLTIVEGADLIPIPRAR